MTDVPDITEGSAILGHYSAEKWLGHVTQHRYRVLQAGSRWGFGWEAAILRIESIASAEKGWRPIHTKGIISLMVTLLLCLPSLIGGAALFVNVLLYRHIGEWGQTSSALVALGVFLGGPPVALATVVGGITAFSRSVSVQIKYAHVFVVSLAAVASLSLLFRFGK